MKLSEKFKNVTRNSSSLQFDHLISVQDFIDNVIPEMLTEKFIPKSELRETTMAILNKRNE